MHAVLKTWPKNNESCLSFSHATSSPLKSNIASLPSLPYDHSKQDIAPIRLAISKGSSQKKAPHVLSVHFTLCRQQLPLSSPDHRSRPNPRPLVRQYGLPATLNSAAISALSCHLCGLGSIYHFCKPSRCFKLIAVLILQLRAGNHLCALLAVLWLHVSV